jgi:hypothetical protein
MQRFLFLSVLLAFLSPSHAEPLKQRIIVDAFGFDRPVDAYLISLPQSWSMKGTVQWYGAASCPMDGPKPHFVAHAPGGTERMEFIPGGVWMWASIYQAMPQMQAQAECRPMPITDGETFMRQYVSAIRPDARMTGLRRRPDLSEKARREAGDMGLNPYQQARFETIEASLSYPSGGEQVKETLISTIAFIDQPGPDGYGGMSGRMTMGMTSGTLSYLAVGGDPDPGVLEAVMASMDADPDYTKRMRRYYEQKLQFMQQAHARKRAAQQAWLASRRAAAASSSSSGFTVDTTGSDILDMQHEGYRSRSGMSDAGQARAVDGIQERAPWASTGGETVYMPQSYQRVFQLPNDVYVGTNDPFFNPVQETGQFGEELSQAPY